MYNPFNFAARRGRTMANTPGPQGKITGAPPQNEPRLESWGEIANYLRRDIRTVQRWEKEQGLPVRRLTINRQGQVYAYRSELDKWILERQPKPKIDEPKENLETWPAETLPPSFRPNKEEIYKKNGLADVLRSPYTWIALALVVAAVVTVALRVNSSTTHKELLFVRPFTNQSEGLDQQQFVNGLTDEIITQIGKLDPKLLGVFAPTTSKELAGKSIEEIRRQLVADFILEGSVRRVNEQLRVDVALITTKDQTPIWTNSYTGNIRQILLLQDTVASDVAKQAGNTIPLPEQNVRAFGKLEVDPEAYDEYVKGRLYWLDRDLARSTAAYQRALQKEPRYAPALAGLATDYVLLGQSPNDAMRPEAAVLRARKAAQDAIEIDPHLADAYCVLANIAQSYDYNLSEAEQLFTKAVELDPNNVTAHEWYGYYLMITRRLPEADAQMKRALEIDPASPLLNTVNAELKYYQRDYDGAIRQATQTLEQHHGFLLAEVWLAWAYREKKMYPQAIAQFDRMLQQSNNNPALLGMYGHVLGVSGDKAEAERVLKQLQTIAHTQYVPALYFAAVYTGLGDKNQAFHWLDEAYKERDDRLLYLSVDPIADPLRSDPRFPELMKRVGLS
jgi:TolB-like protein/tetratricopeptide (TPR) repeat protein